jgi:hypothetical protein
MKVWDLLSGVRTWLTNEENILVKNIEHNGGSVLKSMMDERERIVARGLVNKGVLTRRKKSGKLVYALQKADQLWRI